MSMARVAGEWMVLMRFPVSACAGVALLLAAAPPAAHAQVTGYNDLTAFNAAATTPTVYGFEGIAAANGFASNPSLTPLIVTTGGNGAYFVDSATYVGGNYSLNGTDSLAGAINDSVSPITQRPSLWAVPTPPLEPFSAFVLTAPPPPAQ